MTADNANIILDIASLEARIEEAYRKSGNHLGWRFLYSPPSVIIDAKVAFIGLNPGGNRRPTEHAEFAMTSGSAYCDEEWAGYPRGESPLQRQVRALFTMLRTAPADVLAGNFVPFRSPSWNTLFEPQRALPFARSLWADVFKSSRPELIVTMGTLVRDEVANILGITDLTKYPTGWGHINATRGQNTHTTLISIPHLSRFRIIGRPKSASQISSIFSGFL